MISVLQIIKISFFFLTRTSFFSVQPFLEGSLAILWELWPYALRKGINPIRVSVWEGLGEE